jgi:abhydrolase domain-containing protein 17
MLPKNEGGLGFAENNIIVFGRSMGSGPATLLSSKFRPRALILMSAYTSIKHVAQNVAGKLLGWFVANHFSNIDEIKSVECPAIIIHGKSDNLIPC